MIKYLTSFPEGIQFSISDFIDAFVVWLQVTFRTFLDGFVDVFTVILNGLQGFLGMIPWWVYAILLFLAGWKLYKILTGMVLAVLLILIGMLGFWDGMIYTLTIIFVSVVICLIIGIPLGILMAKSALVEKVLKPILDGMQTLPSFVYLIPALMLFQTFGRVPAVIATTIYAVPPLIRLTHLGIKSVRKDVVEAGIAFGSTPMQMLIKIEIPQSLSTIAAGVNQTTMMAVSMIVIASMIGARGIGGDVLTAVEQIKVGDGFAAGFAIVFLAIILDRLLQGVANKFDRTEGDAE